MQNSRPNKWRNIPFINQVKKFNKIRFFKFSNEYWGKALKPASITFAEQIKLILKLKMDIFVIE